MRKLKKKLDNLWSEIVKKKADYKCEYCGKTSYLNSHHIFSRSNHSVRWDIDNGVCLCAGHHALGNFSAHKAPLEFAEWLIKTRGEDWYEKLKFKSRQISKEDLKDIETKLNEYK